MPSARDRQESRAPTVASLRTRRLPHDRRYFDPARHLPRPGPKHQAPLSRQPTPPTAADESLVDVRCLQLSTAHSDYEPCGPVHSYRTLFGAQMRYAVHDRNGWPLAMLGFSTAACPGTGPNATTSPRCSSRPSSRPRATPAPSTGHQAGYGAGLPRGAVATTATSYTTSPARTSGTGPSKGSSYT